MANLVFITIFDPNRATDGFIMGYTFITLGYDYLANNTGGFSSFLVDYVGQVTLNLAVVNTIDFSLVLLGSIFH